MILVFGGMYQGKTEFARGLIKDRGFAAPLNEPVPDFSAEIADAMDRGEDPDAYVESRIPELRGRVVLMNDYSQGLVPMGPEQRAFREACGRAMIKLAQESDEVYRVFCGIGSRLK